MTRWDIKIDRVPQIKMSARDNEEMKRQNSADVMMDEELDDEWDNELRKEELNIEKEMFRREYETNGFNLRKRFFIFIVVSGTFAGLGLMLSKIIGGVGIDGTEVGSSNGTFPNNGEKLKLSTILYYLACIPFAYFLASFAAVFIKFILSRKKENTRLLVFYFSKMSNYFVLAATGGICTGLLTACLGIWQPSHWALFRSGQSFNASIYYSDGLFLASVVTAWGVVHIMGVILFRNFSIKFFKSAYYDRVIQALFTEYVLIMLSRPTNTMKRKQSSDTTNNCNNSGSSYTAIEDPWDNVKIEKVPIKEKEIITRQISNLRLAEFVTFLQETPYFLVHTAEHGDSSSSYSSPTNLKSVSKNMLGLLKSPHLHKSKLKNGQNRALSARKLGHKLFHFLKSPERNELVQQDFEKHLSLPLAEEAFLLFDKNYDGSLDYREFILTVNEILKERKAISDSLNDAEKALSKLESVFFACFCFIWFFVALFLYGTDVQSTFVSLTSFIVGFAFLFGPVIKSIVDGVIFVFVSHPFDISDRIMINSTATGLPTMYTVMRLNMYNTVLKRSDNAHVVFPNSVMATMTIINLTKSSQMVDIVKFNINTDTPIAKIRKLEKEFKKFLISNSQHYNDVFEFSMNKCENFLEIDVRINHRHNFHNMKRYRERRTNAIYEMMAILEHLEIKNEDLVKPIRKIEQ
eukprot:NODE_355_length_10246_cov_0.288263.p1 type:complete len:690 gc:universal NODE_355_length_10246_cov_0.288263:6861-8930(+)